MSMIISYVILQLGGGGQCAQFGVGKKCGRGPPSNLSTSETRTTQVGGQEALPRRATRGRGDRTAYSYIKLLVTVTISFPFMRPGIKICGWCLAGMATY
jgi:hypothetical protein